jgi:hypothetical protein
MLSVERLTVSDSETVDDTSLESVTLIDTVAVPETVGVPLMTPDVDIERPDGSPVADQVSLPVPPEALSVAV